MKVTDFPINKRRYYIFKYSTACTVAYFRLVFGRVSIDIHNKFFFAVARNFIFQYHLSHTLYLLIADGNGWVMYEFSKINSIAYTAADTN